ncbi:hypothetical protein RJ641_012266 [Dillenia turbinata]|uniref:HMA domain-containing protein n=1 Tax=Dillenia turbinata TaxID=194707 RepID=A0AAN8UW16_9MAGN
MATVGTSGFKKSKVIGLPRTSLASIESLTLPLVQEVVLAADFRCAECQKRVADMMSKMGGTESIVVNVLEKTVTLTCKYPSTIVQIPTKQVAPIHRNPPSKVAMIRRLFRATALSLFHVQCDTRFGERVISYWIMVMRINSWRHILIEKPQCKVIVCGRFRPAGVAIHIRKKKKRRVEILEIHEPPESSLRPFLPL